ncbi:TetR/AcrR family transcriptional regulator [Corynebacterium sp. HS2168-gen11]|uniref:TetR/AcrR family transcriptional regulator n=1 Tax=Corynebacterium sp. HS2168-gen11 TaxID=2974027 RepID=UPI00216B3B24|nr:TetR family transcriptional regulator [Corynebacterium sp. HS2168-gen11]MCS4535796.1 TetR family transcriptional regulator [Corynebacterium sp. HS2168-gen11]
MHMRLGRKTGPKPKFTAQQVIDAVLQIGLDTFTMSQVAASLGVGAPSLYRLYNSRDDLVAACLEDIARRQPWVSPQSSWPDMLHAWARYCWQLCEAFPGFALTLYTYPFPQVNFMKASATIVEDFTATGLDKNLVLFALDFIGDTVISTHLGIGTYRVDSTDHARNELIKRNLELSNEQLGTDLSAFVYSRDPYRDFVEPKVAFIIAALEAGIRPPAHGLGHVAQVFTHE